MELEEV